MYLHSTRSDPMGFNLATHCFPLQYLINTFPFSSVERRGELEGVLYNWNRYYRYYHTVGNHLRPMVDEIEKRFEGTDDLNRMLFAAAFHDVIYDPTRKDNEERSAKVWDKFSLANDDLKNWKHRAWVTDCILQTKNHQPNDDLQDEFNKIDFMPLKESVADALRNERLLFKEFQHCSIEEYVNGRKEFLKSIRNSKYVNQDIIDALIEWVGIRPVSIGIFPGSFNPIHEGHLEVILKADKIFDKVVILTACNSTKSSEIYEAEKRANEIREIVKHHEVLSLPYNTDIVSFTDKSFRTSCPVEVSYIRGIRGSKDVDYEMDWHDYMEDFGNDNPIIFIPSNRDIRHYSSSAIRSIKKLKGYSDFDINNDYEGEV